MLVRRHLLDDLTLSSVLAEHLAIQYVSLDDPAEIDPKIARALPEGIAKRFCLLALREEDGKVVTAMADPLDIVAIDTVMLKMQRPIKPVISAAGEIRRAIEMVYHGSDIEERQLRDSWRSRTTPRTSRPRASPSRIVSMEKPAARRPPTRPPSSASSICC